MGGHLEPDFLTVEDVLWIHAEGLKAYGGAEGICDLGLLESAVAQPQATYGGEYLHNDSFSMAAAYLFHITQNHAFADGNKRTGLTASLTFLRINDVKITTDTDLLYDLTIAVAQGSLEKAEVAEELRRLVLEGGLPTAPVEDLDEPSQEEGLQYPRN